jgi:hypothetical protein
MYNCCQNNFWAQRLYLITFFAFFYKNAYLHYLGFGISVF